MLFGENVFGGIGVCVVLMINDQPTITLRGNALEAVEEFSYLRRKVGHTARADGEVGTQLEKAATVYLMWRRKVFRS